LVAQIPALMMSLCAGIIVTRATNDENKDLGSDIIKELLSDIRVPSVSAGVVLLMGFIPGFPTFVFAGVAALLMLSWFFSRRLAIAIQAEADDLEDAAQADEDVKDGTIENQKTSDRFKVFVGSGIAAHINLDDLRKSIENSFGQLAYARGITFPAPRVEVRDVVDIHELILELDEVPIFQDTIPPGAALMEEGKDYLKLIGCPEDQAKKVNWLDTVGVWVPAQYRAALNELKLEPASVEIAMSKLVFRIYEQNLGLLFSKDEYEVFENTLIEIDPDGVQLVKSALPNSGLMQTLRFLIEDGVPLRPARLVLDALVHWTQTNPGGGPVLISECLRGSLKRQLCHLISGPENVLGVAMIDPELEALARKSVADAKKTGHLASVDGLMFDSDQVDAIIEAFRSLTTIEEHRRKQLAIVTSTDIRRRLRNFLAANNIHVPVLAAHEISSDVMTCPIQLVRMPKELVRMPEMA
jgi:type III secretion protein V